MDYRLVGLKLTLAASIFLCASPLLADTWQVIDPRAGQVKQPFSDTLLDYQKENPSSTWQISINTPLDLSPYSRETIPSKIALTFRDAPAHTLQTCTVVSPSNGLVQCDLSDLDVMDIAKATSMTLVVAGVKVDISTKASFRTITEIFAINGIEGADFNQIADEASARRKVRSSTNDAVSDLLIVNDPKDGWLNLRSGPGTSSSVIKRLDNGTAVKEISAFGNWKKVSDNTGATGWAFGPFLLNNTSNESRGTSNSQSQSQARSRSPDPDLQPQSTSNTQTAQAEVDSQSTVTTNNTVPTNNKGWPGVLTASCHAAAALRTVKKHLKSDIDNKRRIYARNLVNARKRAAAGGGYWAEHLVGYYPFVCTKNAPLAWQPVKRRDIYNNDIAHCNTPLLHPDGVVEGETFNTSTLESFFEGFEKGLRHCKLHPEWRDMAIEFETEKY